MAAGVGTGTAVTFSAGTFTANVLSVDGPGMTRESFQTSNMATSDWHTHIPGDLADAGELTIEYQFEGNDIYPTLIIQAANTITIDVAGTGAGFQWSASGFATSATPAIPFEDIMTASVTFKLTGAVTISSP